MSLKAMNKLHQLLGEHTLDEIAIIVERIVKENKQHKEQVDIERRFYALYVMLHTAWMEAQSNEECAHILRIFVTDIERFQEEFPRGERSYRKGSQAYKLWKKTLKDAQAKAASSSGSSPAASK